MCWICWTSPKVTGMYGENADLLHGQRVQSIGKLCKNGVVPGVPSIE